ncbi:MAG TPA: arylsulfatase [Bryobacteraceae bacterium]|nr:arylsulfatase [Bryobacteraceae bacterium]
MFTRRTFLAAATGPLLAQESLGRPNVIFILADDLGYGDLGCYGQKLIRTPNIDALAADGVRFTQVYAGSTVCAPSRCALMTGKHTGHATVRGNVDPHIPLQASEATLADVFQRAGYRTGMFGKWGLGTPPDMHALPTRKGFDEFFGYLHQVHAHTYYPDMLWDNEREHYLPKNFGGAKKEYSHDLIADRALKFIDSNKDRPFFIYGAFTPPHGRFEAPDDGEYKDQPWPAQARTLASMMGRLDATVGQMVARLKQHGIADNTLIIFTSDNGPGGMSVKTFASNGPLRGLKRDLYEGGIRVPFIARWPAKIKPGVSDEVFAFWDMLPTFAELTDQPAPKEVDGVSVMQVLLGRGHVPQPDRTLYWEFHERGFAQAVRWRNYKAVRQAPADPVEVYDLAVDPGEKRNIAAERPELALELTKRIEAARTASPHWPSAKPSRGTTGE